MQYGQLRLFRRLLIGWDDAKGAFLCKNSWGGGGPNGDGTFWISYADHANDLGFGMINFDVAALSTCTSDAECDDGVYCNGAEACVAGACQSGTPVSCANDGRFCNGAEVCDEASASCASIDPPCRGEVCVEDGDGQTDCADAECANDSACQEPPPSCGLKKNACSSNDDCCSGRCNVSKGICL